MNITARRRARIARASEACPCHHEFALESAGSLSDWTRRWGVPLGVVALLVTAIGAGSPPQERTSVSTTMPVTTRPVKKIDETLVERLLGGKSSEVDTVEKTLGDMEQAARRLTERFDPGEETQRAQREIITGLDKMIEQARKNRPSSDLQRSQRPGEPRQGGRRAGDMNQPRQSQGASDPGPSDKGGQGAPQRDDKGAEARRRTDKAELSRGWGFLPPRARDEILQGFDEVFPPKYREQVIEYYRNLAERALSAQKEP